tara:strand:- start:48441 stop:50387 length:1947 start_codon:yes stop_codon:yes gene_type:complete
MLNVTPSNLMQEVRSAEIARDDILKESSELWDEYAAGHGKSNSGKAIAENHPYQYVSTHLPNLVYSNPRVNVTTTMPISQKETAVAMRAGLNQWVRDVNLANFLNHTAMDFFFDYGIVLATLEDRPGYHGHSEDVPMTVNVSMITPNQFIIDPACNKAEEARFMGHEIFYDKDDLVDISKEKPELGWNHEMLTLAVTSEREADAATSTKGGTPPRNQVKVFEIWVPEYTLSEGELPDSWKKASDEDEEEGEEDGQDGQGNPVDPAKAEYDTPSRAQGYHGTIFTILEYQSHDESKQQAYARQPQPYFGPPWGPYTIFGCHIVNKQPFPYSPLQATKKQADHFNKISLAMAADTAAYKKFILATGQDEADKIKNVKNGDVEVFPEFDPGSIGDFEVGGITDQQLRQHSVAADRLDRNSGLSATQRGAPAAGVTATAESIAAGSSDARTSWHKHRFTMATSELLKTVSWHFYYADEIRFPLGQESLKSIREESRKLLTQDGMNPIEAEQLVNSVELEPIFEGGDRELPGSLASWYSLGLEIDPYSMEKTDEALTQKRSLEILKTMSEIIPIMLQTPQYDWAGFIDSTIGQSNNMPNLSQYFPSNNGMEDQMSSAMINDQGSSSNPVDGQLRSQMAGAQDNANLMGQAATG